MNPPVVLLGALLLLGCTASPPLPPPSPQVHPKNERVRGALVWRGRGSALPPGAREVHRGEEYHPGNARILLLDTAPRTEFCAMTGNEPGGLLAASCDWSEGNTTSVQSISIVAGVTSTRHANLRVVRTASARGELGVLAVEGVPGATLHGGEVPALLCE